MQRFDEKHLTPLAHSADNTRGISEQTYADHLVGVGTASVTHARNVARYAANDADAFINIVRLAAEYHDLGKLDAENQAVLRGDKHAQRLPIHHQDAGASHLMSHEQFLSALLVYAHHIGLPSRAEEENRLDDFCRDNEPFVRTRVNETLATLLREHHAFRPMIAMDPPTNLQCDPSLFLRLALSCLVDADHHDTAKHYNDTLSAAGQPLDPQRRLASLDEYVAHLSKIKQTDRTSLRTRVYHACRDSANTHVGLCSCDSPVGTGKTTAVMAHLLNIAQQKHLRRIFVVLPFTNIINQSVDVYRKALVAPNEDPRDIVAAHHHRAEFDSPELRQYAILWHAPIVVTTAVQFFETLASNRPSALRKLHQLPGSAIFIDESHAALPPHLWPQAWRWLKLLRNEWSCHIVLGSGSLSRFWTLEDFDPDEHKTLRVPELIDDTVRREALTYETHRVIYKTRSAPLTLDDLLDWLSELPGPRLLIVNTVQSAAAIADAIASRCGRRSTEHLSTALTPKDRTNVLTRIHQRLNNEADTDWTLVATSCVEAGVDLSFRTGLRERCSFTSLIQTGGRINRNGKYNDAVLHDFVFQYDEILRRHPAFDISAKVLVKIFSEHPDGITPDLATEAIRREIREAGIHSSGPSILEREANCDFPAVEKEFKVIDTCTVTAIVDSALKERMQRHEKIPFDDIQNGSVQIWLHRKGEYDLQPIPGFDDLFFWNLAYDDFVGYMAGVLTILKNNNQGGTIL